jgi:hypothetical protein
MLHDLSIFEKVQSLLDQFKGSSDILGNHTLLTFLDSKTGTYLEI